MIPVVKPGSGRALYRKVGGVVELWSSAPALNPDALVENLPTPFYVAHRGAGFVAGENSISAFAAAVDGGTHVIETDVRLLSDGTPVIMHDATVDRTTDGTGNVADKSLAQWQALAIDHTGLVGGTWTPEAPPTLEQVLTEYGNQVCLSLQPYAGGVAVIDDMVEDLGIDKGTIIITSSSTQDRLDAQALGYTFMPVDGSVNPGWSTHAANGVDRVSMLMSNVTQAEVDAAHAAGVKVIPYSPTGHYSRDKMLALGVDGLITDAPGWLSETLTYRTTDAFDQQKPQVGQQTLTGTTRLAYKSPDIANSVGANVHLLGYLRPEDPSNYSVTFEARVNEDAGNTANAFYLLAAKSDFVSLDGRATQAGVTLDASDGYRFGVLTNPGISTALRAIILTNNANAGNLLTNGPSAYVEGAWITYRLTVTPTTLRWEQLTGGAGAATTINNANSALHRPLPYLFLASTATIDVDFRNIVLA